MSCESDTLLVRAAVAEDAVSLAAIDAEVSLRPLSEAGYKRICEQGSPGTGLALALECESDAELCGFVLYTRVLDEGSINNIAVRPGCQGRGYGRLLLNHALAQMREQGAVRCLLDVRESNSAARALYESEGFSLDGRRPGYYSTEEGAREDALLMSKQL